jgi:uncharacterized protein
VRRAAVVGFLCAVVSSPGPLVPAHGATPSFDCGRATAPIEKLICSSDALANLDAALSATFREAREGRDDAAKAAMLQDQRHWLQSRFIACAIPAKGDIAQDEQAKVGQCLSDLYTARIAALKAQPAVAATNTAASSAPAASPQPAPAQSAASQPAAVKAGIRLDKTLFPAKGNNETVVNIETFGRYSLMVKSDQGTAIQYVDRMAGPSAVDGSAGHGDGRIDAFLDRGQYKVRLLSDPRGSGDAELSVAPFTELNPDPQQLIELKPIAAELGDHEQRSYWLDIKERRFVAIEAAGRYLTDLRLWKDGNWLVEAVLATGLRDPSGGEPLAIRQLALWLEPGLYRLVAYGGVGEKWPSGSAAKPLYIRYGIPTLPDAGRAIHEASPVGVDRWIVPASATYFRIDIDNAEHTALSVASYDSEHPYATGGNRATIEKDSRDPKAEVWTGALPSDKAWLVTVERKPGTRYRLQYFDDRRERILDIPGSSADYWLATLQAGNVGDALDPTAILVEDGKTVVAASPVQIDPAKAWHRKFNLIGPVTLFLHTDQPMDIVTEGKGADAEYRIEPFLTFRPTDYHIPPSKTAGGTWKIDSGYSVLEIMPREGGKGILDLTLRPAGATGAPADQPRLAAPVFPKLAFERDHSYQLYLSATGERFGGASAQKLPLDLANGASFQLAGGAPLDISVKVPAAGKLEAHTEDGKDVALAIDGNTPANGPLLKSGEHRLSLTAPGSEPIFIALRFTPTERQQTAPLPPVDPARLAERPNFQALSPDKPVYLDLAHNELATFAVSVDKPALYRLESNGIIETEGTIRTRTVTSLDQQAANGVGRNFLIQQYLREGDYQLTARPSGESYGAIGVSVNATDVAELGDIEPEVWVRATLRPGQAGRYRFHIAEAGKYRLHTLGLGHEFAMRLDDGGGWPILKPGATADTTQQFEAGDYQLVLLPQPVESRAVTLLQRIVQPPELSGHGPFALALGATGHNRWMEPEKGAPRTPDRWTFSLPAEADVRLTVDSGMRATLVQNGATTDKVALSERPFVGTLPAGDYAIEVVSAAPNSRVDYTINLSTDELVAGQTRSITAPARVPISIGEDRQIKIASFGNQDVKARLYDGEGRLVAVNDDRENDWNFLIATRLQPGRYTLHVDPVGGAQAETDVSLTQPEEVRDPALAFGKPVTLADGKVHVLPLPDAQAGKLMLLTTHAATAVGLAVEALDGDKWRTLGSASGANPYLALAPSAGMKLRARVWSVAHDHLPIEIAVISAAPVTAAETALTGRGVTLSPLDGAASGLAAAEISLSQPGVLQLGSGGDTVQWAAADGRVAAHDATGTIVAPGTKLWLIDRADPKGKPAIVARRLDPEGKEPIHLVVHGAESVQLPVAPVTAASDPVLWQVDGQGGQPGISVIDSASAADANLLAVGADSPTLGSAVAVAPAAIAKPSIRIWNAGAAGADLEMPVTLRRVAFHAPKSDVLPPGITDGAFAGQEARLVTLPSGLKRLSLVLPQGTAAVLKSGGTAEQMIWAVSPRAAVVETTADRLMLLHPGADAAPYSITVEPLDGKAPAELAAGSVFSRYSPTPGILRLRVARGGNGLRVAGAATAATLLTPSGSVLRGADLKTPQDGGLVEIAHGTGLFAVSLDAQGKAGGAPSDAQTVKLPADTPLSGQNMRLHIQAGAARLVHMTSDVPVVLRAGADAGPTLFGAGANLDFVMAKDQAADLDIGPAGVSALSGTAHFASIDLTPIGEGLGPKRRLGPGQSRAFSFVLPQPRTVGVGVRASVDVANSRLLAADGTEIGRGLVHMHDLAAGTYVLVVDAPADGPAIDIEPALVGTEVPDRGPPADVKASYLALVGKQAKN